MVEFFCIKAKRACSFIREFRVDDSKFSEANFGMKFVFSYATLATPFLVGTLFFLMLHKGTSAKLAIF